MHSGIAAGAICAGLAAAFVAAVSPTADPQWRNPEITAAGEIVVLPDATFQPTSDSKVVFDATAQKSPRKPAAGLVKAARWINLNRAAKIDPDRIQVAVVLHGDATKAALNDPAYARVSKSQENPNRQLINQLQQAGVELYVCGQALAHRRYQQDDVLPEVKVVTAALTVLARKQRTGFSFLPD